MFDIFNPIFDGLAALLAFFYDLVPNYAAAITMLTLAVMLLVFPLTAKSVRSMAAMAKLSPELKKIQAANKNDRAKQSEETMALFKEHKVTPFGGCLPLLVQAPILFIMYRILIGLTHRDSDGRFDPKYLDHGTRLYQDLHQSTTMNSFGMDLALTAGEAVKESFTRGLPYFVLIGGVVASGYWAQRMMARRNPQQNLDDNPMAKQMQMMTRIYPLMYLVFGFTLPAGINVYFLVSSLFRIGQQTLIYKMDPSLLPAAPSTPHVPAAKTGGTGAAGARSLTAKAKGKVVDDPEPTPKAKTARTTGKVAPATNGRTTAPAANGKARQSTTGRQSPKKRRR